MQPYTNVVGRRVVAHLIDLVLLTASQLAVFFAVADKGPALSSGFETDDVFAQITLGDDRWFLEGGSAGLYILGVGALWFVYYVIVQGLSGRTLGKKLLGVRVVDSAGASPGVGRAFVRSLMWIVDSFPYLIPYLTGFVAALVSSSHQRLGDKVAGTFVVDAGRLRNEAPGGGLGGLGQSDGLSGLGESEPSGLGPSFGVAPAAAEVAPAAAPTTPAGWHADPQGAARLRWWDGQRWTDQTSD